MAKSLILDGAASNVCYWHKADIPVALNNVCYWGKADIAVSERQVWF